MTSNFRPEEIAAFQYLLASKDLPDEIADQLRKSLSNFDRAFQMSQQFAATYAKNLEKLYKAEREAPFQLAEAISENKTTTAPKMVSELATLRSVCENDREKLELVTTAAQRLKNEPMRIYTHNIAGLLRWVAQQRCKDLLAYGEVMPVEVVHIYKQVVFRWYPTWDESLDISPQTFNRLPLNWHDTWTDTHRASLAWVFLQLAAGNFTYKPNPKQPNGEPVIRMTEVVTELPPVPKQKPAPKNVTVWH